MSEDRQDDLDVTSRTKEEKIRNHRDRILKGLDKLASEYDETLMESENTRQNKGNKNSLIVTVNSELQRLESGEQIVNSLSHLEKVKSDGIRKVTDVQIAAESEENYRRLEEEKRRDHRLTEFSTYQKESMFRNETFETSWSALLSETNETTPLTFQGQLNQLRSKYSATLSWKNALIQDFRKQMIEKDEIYIKTLKQQERNFDLIQKAIIFVSQEIKRAYNCELTTIEDAFSTDRNNILSQTWLDFGTLTRTKHTVEEKNIMILKQLREKIQARIIDAHDSGNYQYLALKNELEPEISRLECSIESSRRKYRVSSDLIDYEHRVKTKENKGNELLIKRQKKILSKCKDELNRTRESFCKMKALNTKKITSLEKECKRAESKARNVQSQLHFFRSTNDRRYRSILTMHINDIYQIKLQTHQAEKRVYEQILGISYDSALNAPATEVKEEILHLLSTKFESHECDPRYYVLDGFDDSDDTLDDLLFARLYSLLNQYRRLAESRADAEDYIDKARRENNHLEQEIQRCMNSDITKTLIVPPIISKS